MRRTIVVASCLAVIGAIAWIVSMRDDVREEPVAETGLGEEQSGGKNESASGTVVKTAAPVADDSVKRKGKRMHVPRDMFDDPDHPYSEEDKRIAKSLQDVLDEISEDDDSQDAKNRLMETAALAAKSANPSVRLRAVDAFAWIGKDALPSMTPMMADKDEDVAEQAIDSVQQALLDIDSAYLRFDAAVAYMSAFSVNEEAISMLGGISSGAAMEFVNAKSDSPEDAEEALKRRETFVGTMDTLISIAKGGCEAEAKEMYEDVTGSPWINVEEAVLWARDPDNYEVPEDRAAAKMDDGEYAGDDGDMTPDGQEEMLDDAEYPEDAEDAEIQPDSVDGEDADDAQESLETQTVQ